MFNGNLLEISGEPFPLQYVVEKSYKVVPKRVQDLDPYTTETGFLIRNPVEHEPTNISFETRALTNTEMNALMTFITSRYTDAKHRKVRLTYYIPITDSYDTGDFYFNSNMEFTIRQIDRQKNFIKYEPFTLDFIEY